MNDLKLRIHSDDPRLKRQINHDSQSAAYPVDVAGLTIANVEWTFHLAAPLNQLDTGKCTAEAATDCLACDPFWATLSAGQQDDLNDAWTDRFYSDEETLDGDGPFPPNDNGSSGLTSAKVAKARGLISGYLHAFSAEDAIKAVQTAPLSWGTLWKSGMDNIDTTTGRVKYSGTTRGGHEISIYKIVAAAEQVWFRNSWNGWGYRNLGVGWISFADFEKSLADQGDVTQFVPLTAPAPTPIPTPSGDPLATFAASIAPWLASKRCGANRAAQQTVKTFLASEGLST